MGKSIEKTSSTGLLLIPGFPAPCDVLPLGGINEERIYQQTSEAGGSVFTKSYRVSSKVYTVEQAKANGWIRGDLPNINEFLMVSANDDNGRTVIKQLWSIDGNWWVYEETPMRRSWLKY